MMVGSSTYSSASATKYLASVQAPVLSMPGILPTPTEKEGFILSELKIQVIMAEIVDFPPTPQTAMPCF